MPRKFVGQLTGRIPRKLPRAQRLVQVEFDSRFITFGENIITKLPGARSLDVCKSIFNWPGRNVFNCVEDAHIQTKKKKHVNSTPVVIENSISWSDNKYPPTMHSFARINFANNNKKKAGATIWNSCRRKTPVVRVTKFAMETKTRVKIDMRYTVGSFQKSIFFSQAIANISES